MNNWIRLPGFPPPEKQGTVRFHVLKSLPYASRMILYLLLIAVGFSVQILMMQVWPGVVFLVFATVLTLVRGYDSRVRMKNFEIDSTWTKVDIQRIKQIEELDKKNRKWDRDTLDISSGTGFLLFILTLVGLFFVSSVIGDSSRLAGQFFRIDGIILFLPLWFNGIRKKLTHGNLNIKADLIKTMEAFFQTIKQPGENFSPSLMLARDKTGKTVPTDCRLTISFDDMPADFYGIQAQINLNLVQGTSYPYFYCVIAAKPGFGLKSYVDQIPLPKQIIVEYQEDSNAEVIVIRRKTTKNSGYHTPINNCKSILDRALVAARMILGKW